MSSTAQLCAPSWYEGAKEGFSGIMGENWESSEKQTRQPWGGRPKARFALWRPAAVAGVELQIGTQIEAYALPVHFHDSYHRSQLCRPCYRSNVKHLIPPV
jgi:hypothetical protein